MRAGPCSTLRTTSSCASRSRGAVSTSSLHLATAVITKDAAYLNIDPKRDSPDGDGKEDPEDLYLHEEVKFVAN